MSRHIPEDVRLTRTSSFGQNNVKGKLDTYDGILNTLANELHQLSADTSVKSLLTIEFQKILSDSQKITLIRTGQ